MEKGSLHPMGQVVTLHQTKKEERHVGLILQAISYIRSIHIEALKKTNQHEERCKTERKVQGQKSQIPILVLHW